MAQYNSSSTPQMECSVCGLIFRNQAHLNIHFNEIHRAGNDQYGEIRNWDVGRGLEALQKPDFVSRLKASSFNSGYTSPIDTFTPDFRSRGSGSDDRNNFNDVMGGMFKQDHSPQEKPFSRTPSGIASDSFLSSASENDDHLMSNIFYNTNKETWDCGICRKSFREKNDLFQHLRSGTHEAKRFSCSDCGKAFASLGALAQHVEQSGHSRGSKTLIQEVDHFGRNTLNSGNQTPFTSSLYDAGPRRFHSVHDLVFHGGNVNPITRPVPPEGMMFPPRQLITDRRRSSSDSRLRSINMNITGMMNQGSRQILDEEGYYEMPPEPPVMRSIPPFQPIQGPTCTLYFCGVAPPRSLQGGCAWVIKDDRNDTVIIDGVKPVDLIYPMSVRAEFEGLHIGLIEAINRGIRRLHVIGDCELAILKFKSRSALSCCQTVYRIVDDISSHVRACCEKFQEINFELLPRESVNPARIVAKSLLLRD
jgi:hypothetical protein